jgi:hypothetical protein
MRAALFVLLIASIAGAGHVAARENTPACAVQKARDVGFRSAAALDVLEVAVGPGPCHTASLTIILRAKDDGAILYSYVAPLRRQIGISPQDPEAFVQRAMAVVDEIAGNKLGSTADLPPWQEPNAYHSEHGAEVKISRQAYEALRKKPQPLFEHPNHYEGWQIVVYDAAKEEGVIILAGGA